jgi:hypothetical protein
MLIGECVEHWPQIDMTIFVGMDEENETCPCMRRFSKRM